MVAYTKTFTNTVTLLGDAPSSKWAASGTTSPQKSLIWGTGKWGADSDVIQKVQKLVASGTPVTAAVALHAAFFRTIADSQGLDSEVAAFLYILAGTITNTISAGSETTSEKIRDAQGYVRLFDGRAEDGENRIWDGAARTADPATTFAAVSAAATTWSAV